MPEGGITGRGFRKGQSGNPNGRPKVVLEIRDLARQFGPAAIAKLAEMAGLAPGTPAEAEATRVATIKELLDRGYGRATQHIAGDAEGPPVVIEFLWGDATEQPQSEPQAIDGDVEAGGFIVAFAGENTC